MKKLYVFGALVLILAICCGLLLSKNKSLNDQASISHTQFLAHEAAEAQLWLQNSKERYDTKMAPVVATGTSGYVYLPELQIRLPYGELAKSLTYAMRENSGIGGSTDPSEADISSTSYVPPTQPTRMDCSYLARVNIEQSPHAYSPQEKPTSVALSDGRTLQIYEFVGDQECQTSWAATVSPAQVTAALKQAQSY